MTKKPQTATPRPFTRDGRDNQDRATWAGLALKLFQLLTGTDREDVYTDLIYGLMHLADREGVDFANELGKAASRYEAESDEAAGL